MPPLVRKGSWIAHLANAAGSWVDRTAIDVALDVARRSKGPRPDPEQQLRQLAAWPRPTATRGCSPSPTPSSSPRRCRACRGARALAPRGRPVDDLRVALGFETVHARAPARLPRLRGERVRGTPAIEAPGATRATVMCIHGYLGGKLGFEEAPSRRRWLYRLGLDVLHRGAALSRRARHREGTAGDLPRQRPLALRRGLRPRACTTCARGTPGCGRAARLGWSFGMSLGGYTAALLATVDPTVRLQRC
jgi:hypothetical protein